MWHIHFNAPVFARKAGGGPYRARPRERVKARPTVAVQGFREEVLPSDQVDMTQQSAGEWMKASGHRFQRRAKSQRSYKSPALADHLRDVRERPETQKEFVERMRSAKSAECIFVPHAISGRPATVEHCGRNIRAARYMALLTFGTPRHQDAEARHLCGNGHLSCINPAHLEWGSPSDNRADANKHRGCETAQDKIHATAGRK